MQLYCVYAASPVTVALELPEEAVTVTADPNTEGEHVILYPVRGPFRRWSWGGDHVTRTLLEPLG